MARSASAVAERAKYIKTDYICTSKESEKPAPDTLDETLPFDGQKIRMGDSKYATAKWFWDGTVLRSGENKYGRGMVWSDGIDIRSGENKYGTLLFYRDGTRIKTEGKYGKVVFTVEGSIPLPILIWISVID